MSKVANSGLVGAAVKDGIERLFGSKVEGEEGFSNGMASREFIQMLARGLMKNRKAGKPDSEFWDHLKTKLEGAVGLLNKEHEGEV